jgi:hypothetical protein
MITATPKTVADPCDSYESMKELWTRSRAVCRGEKFVKSCDKVIDTLTFKNFLIPFSPTMTQQQYTFYKAEAELPGISGQFGKTLVGGLLRKAPTLKFPDGVPDEAQKWIMHSFGKDDSPILTFMDEILWEEIQTNRAWIFIDYANVPNPDAVDPEILKKLKPYPVIHKAENIINWKTTEEYGRCKLSMVIVAGYTEEYDDDQYQFHPKLVDTRWVHELNAEGNYQVRIYKEQADTKNVEYQNGEKVSKVSGSKPTFVLVDTLPVKVNGNLIQEIPAWPLNGSIEPEEPLMTPIIDKEIALYNKISRRNHLMYGAATYTPYVKGNITDEQFGAVADAGLGSWLHIQDPDGSIEIVQTPTEALNDMLLAIAAGYEEIAKLGVRMLAPETGDQSGVALELRNASQQAQLASLNTKVSNIMRQVITFMVNWRYELEIDSADVEFELSKDFIATPKGADWLRLATEWYQSGLIPRDDWLFLLKQNDMLKPEYDDEEGQKEINSDELVVTPVDQHQAQQDNFAAQQELALKKASP